METSKEIKAPKKVKKSFTLQPRFDKITIPYYNSNGFLVHDLIEKADFNDSHIERIMEFWDTLVADPKSGFNKEKAIDTTFIRTELFSEIEVDAKYSVDDSK